MKKIYLVLLVLIISFSTLFSQVPISLNLRFGDSETKGLLGTELQISKFSLNAGWRPVKIPFGKIVSSFCTAITFYPKDDFSWYFTVGRASKGFMNADEMHFNPLTYNNYDPEPLYVGIIGYRFNTDYLFEKTNNRLFLDVGFGYGVSKHSNNLTFEVSFAYKLFGNFRNKILTLQKF